MATRFIPVKTAEGHAELSQRQRRLSQRHRTVLLLVDGRRPEEDVRSLAQQAGATETCFDELLAMGLIALPQPVEPPPVTVPATLPVAQSVAVAEQALPRAHAATGVQPPGAVQRSNPPPAPSTPPMAAEADSLLPTVPPLLSESVMGELAPAEPTTSPSALSDFDAMESARTDDAAMEEARRMLLAAVRREAPLTGSLTMLKLRRARTRDELTALLDEVEARIIKPYRSLAAQQVLRRVRGLLSDIVDTMQPVG